MSRSVCESAWHAIWQPALPPVILSAHAKDLSCVRLAPAWERFLAAARNDKYQGWAPRLTEPLRSTIQDDRGWAGLPDVIRGDHTYVAELSQLV